MTTEARGSLSQSEIGDVLVERGLITGEQRDWALGVHAQTGSPLETILVASGLVNRKYLYWFLGELWGAPYMDLTRTRLDPALLDGLEPERLVREGWVPVCRVGDMVLAAGPHPPTEEWVRSLEATLGSPVDYAMTTDWDVRWALQHAFRPVILDKAALGLWRR